MREDGHAPRRRTLLLGWLATAVSACGGGGGGGATGSGGATDTSAAGAGPTPATGTTAAAAIAAPALSLVDLTKAAGIDVTRARAFFSAPAGEVEMRHFPGSSAVFVVPLAMREVAGRLIVRQDGAEVRNLQMTVIPGVQATTPGESARGFLRGSLQIADQALALTKTSARATARMRAHAQARRDAIGATLAMVDNLMAGRSVSAGVDTSGKAVVITPEYLTVLDILAERSLQTPRVATVASQPAVPSSVLRDAVKLAFSAEGTIVGLIATVEGANQYIQAGTTVAGSAAAALGATAAILGAPALVPIAATLATAALMTSVLGNLSSLACKLVLDDSSNFGTHEEVIGIVTSIAEHAAPGLEGWGKAMGDLTAGLQMGLAGEIQPAIQYAVRQATNVAAGKALEDSLEDVLNAASAPQTTAPPANGRVPVTSGVPPASGSSSGGINSNTTVPSNGCPFVSTVGAC